MIKTFLISVIMVFIFYSFLIEPNLITVKRINIESAGIKNVRVVFLSDFHFSRFANLRIKRIVNKVNKENPDIVLLGGDYAVMHNIRVSMDMNKIADNFSKIHSKYGVYSVLGNHDYNRESAFIKEKLKEKGINILENNSYKLDINGQKITIAGISDMQTTYYSLDKALKNTEPPVILVSHSPDIMPFAKEKTDFIFSGHTHGGQVRVPFFGAVIVPSKYGKKYESGLIENKMYVTKGLGTSIFHLRFNCLPEIVTVDFI